MQDSDVHTWRMAISRAVAFLTGLGLYVLPVVPGGKRPAERRWQMTARVDPGRAMRMIGEHPGCNLGVATGADSGVFVLDIDRKGVDGLETLAALEAEHGKLPPTWRTDTPSGGQHLWFAWPRDQRITNRAGFAPGLDVRGAGGFVVAAPSRTSQGAYRWAAPPRRQDLAHAPPWLLKAIAGPRLGAAADAPIPIRPVSVTDRTRLANYLATALACEVQRVEQAPCGRRNHLLFQAAANLGQLVGAGVLQTDLVETGLGFAAEACGLTRDDGRTSVEATIRSGLRRGMSTPRELAS